MQRFPTCNRNTLLLESEGVTKTHLIQTIHPPMKVIKTIQLLNATMKTRGFNLVAGFGLLMAGGLLAGCIGGQRQAYPGPALPQQQIATLKMPQFRKISSREVQVERYPLSDLMLYRVDGKKVFDPQMVTLLPGQHNLVFMPGNGMVDCKLVDEAFMLTSQRAYVFNFEAGKTYYATPHYLRVDRAGKPIGMDVSSISTNPNFFSRSYYKWWVTIGEVP
jgi:hypothetical protein